MASKKPDPKQAGGGDDLAHLRARLDAVEQVLTELAAKSGMNPPEFSKRKS